jgi:hypothetical protein
MKIFVWTLRSTGLVLLTAVALAGACDANHVLGVGGGGQAGESQGSLAGAPGAAGGIAGGTAGAVTTGAGGAGGMVAMHGPLGPSQSWTGYAENHQFNSGSDQIKLTFATDANGVAAGTVVFGMGTPPPPATDPNVGYPPSNYYQSAYGGFSGQLVEAYPYQFDGGSFDGSRLKLSVELGQLWSGWCALQTPPVPSDPFHGCLPAWPTGIDGDGRCYQVVPVTHAHMYYDCGKLLLCESAGACECSASGCTYSTDNGTQALDMFMSGDTLSGSGVGPVGGNVHLVRD